MTTPVMAPSRGHVTRDDTTECERCGDATGHLPCPFAEACECSSMRRSGFTNTGPTGTEWWVCPECGRPTEAWLIVTLEEVGLTRWQYLTADESVTET